LIWPFGRPTWCFIPKEFWFGIHVTTPWACGALRQNIDVLVLGLVAPPGLVGAYALCKRIVDSSLVTVKSLTRLVYPRLAVAKRESPRAILMLVTSYLKAMIALAVVTALALFLFAPALPIAFGSDFALAVPILKVLCWTLVLTVVQWAAFDALGA